MADEPKAHEVEQLRLRERLASCGSCRSSAESASRGELAKLERQIEQIAVEPSADEVWHSVELARHQDRPYTLDYVERMCDDFVELKGDRTFSDDPAIVAGLARFRGRTVAAGRPPEGPRHPRADAPQLRDAVPGGLPQGDARHGPRRPARVTRSSRSSTRPAPTRALTAEQHGQGGWIARCQLAMIGLTRSLDCCVIGEGGSGGAVAIAVADRVLMQENAIYSVISPEGCAAILWRDASEAKKAAAAFKPDARHCLELGVIDGIVPEPEGGAHVDHDAAATLLVRRPRRGARGRRRRRPGAAAVSTPDALPLDGRLHRLTGVFARRPQLPQAFPQGRRR